MEILNQQAENVCLEPQPPQQIAPMAARIFRGMFGITAGRLWSSEGNTLYRPPTFTRPNIPLWAKYANASSVEANTLVAVLVTNGDG